MEALLVDKLPAEPGWQFEPKWDGFRCIAVREGDEVALQAKSGKPLGRYFPEIVELVRSLPEQRFVLDGELAIPLGDTLSFDALQLRLHPAESRIRKLSGETPAIFILFDLLLAPDGRSLVGEPLTERRAQLEAFFQAGGGSSALRLSPYTRDAAEAQAWLDKAGGAMDGVIAKRLDGPYQSGERAMLKVKRLRTADCVVGGFRYASKGREVGSLLLGLFKPGRQARPCRVHLVLSPTRTRRS
jgi:ATP-dependent DNA ligase